MCDGEVRVDEVILKVNIKMLPSATIRTVDSLITILMSK